MPPAIAANEIKPDALKNPAYLTRNRYELVREGEVVPPWPENIAAIGHGVRVRQTPGPHNALGGVKFVMPNDFQVYLHDTPTKAYFERTRRDASHGCIRVSDPVALAQFLLRDRPEWTEEKVREAMAAGEPRKVTLRTPIPVFIVYETVLARENGEVYFYPDIYGLDAALEAALARGYPYRCTSRYPSTGGVSMGFMKVFGKLLSGAAIAASVVTGFVACSGSARRTARHVLRPRTRWRGTPRRICRGCSG